MLDWANGHSSADTLVAVGHRVAHGGQELTVPVLLRPRIVQILDGLAAGTHCGTLDAGVVLHMLRRRP